MADFGLPSHTIQQIRQVFSQHPTLEKVTLYGSRAKGNYHNGSDIDLTLEGKKLTARTLYRIDEELEELLLPYTFDLSLLKEIDNSDLLGHIRRIGIVFYSRQ